MTREIELAIPGPDLCLPFVETQQLSSCLFSVNITHSVLFYFVAFYFENELADDKYSRTEVAVESRAL